MAGARDLVATPVDENEGRITQIIEGQQKLIEQLSMSLGLLRTRIDPICLSTPEKTSPGPVPETNAITSPLENALIRCNDQVVFLINRVDNWRREVRL